MKTIAVIMGGYSSEYEISLKSGEVVYEHLDKDLYEVFRVHIFKNKWVVLDDAGNEYPIDKSNFSALIDNKMRNFDCVFNAIHGSPGEDGYMQGYFELLGIPHTSCTMYQAALTFNKRDLLATLKPYGIRSAENYYINKGDTVDAAQIVSKVGLPCFVKANRAGSSFGISKVYKSEDLEEAIQSAFKEDHEVIIESFLDGTEVSVGVITYKGEIMVLPITEIVSENDFFDYKAKYQGESQEITPARISREWQEKVSTIARQIYMVLGLSGFSRSEFIFKDGHPYLLEVNTVPGLTAESILPQQAAEAGINLKDLFGNAIEEALQK
ncbi:D-alanine--D-alanine ligase [Winogradskyella aurantiaca]|uniref:D-alanine--D-alanine ligase n=1 Tax=Winogradskyella aurantiaca TaxID=2219558 RepID=UPI000E1D25E6|nr:D-alanine--D-alanine ligase [Winogradskyella aurantiaca]